MRDLFLSLLKSLLIAEILHHVPSLAAAIIRFAARRFIPHPQRDRWEAEWLAELEVKQASGSRLGLLLFAFGALKAAPQVSWIEISHGCGVMYLGVAAHKAVLTWRLKHLMQSLGTLDRYALAKADLHLKLKQELAVFLLVPGLWLFCIFQIVALLSLAQHNSWWWLLLVPAFLYLFPIGPLAFMGCFNRLADTGLLARNVLTYPRSRAKLVERIGVLEVKLGSENKQAHEEQRRIVMQQEQLVVVGLPNAKPLVRHGVSFGELQVKNLGPSHLVVEKVMLSFRREMTITGELFLPLAPGETVPLLNQNLVDTWLERFNEERWQSHHNPITTIDVDMTLSVKAAAGGGSLETTRAVRLRSDKENFYVWYEADDGLA